MTVPPTARHHRRFVTDLNGTWDFAFLGDVEVDAIDVGTIAFDERMPVPACFDATPRFAGKRGVAVYRTTITPQGTGRCRLILDGVHHWNRTFIDGRAIGDHAGGFTRFHHDVIDINSPAELIVLVDNRLDCRTSPLHQPHYDWYQYGGIARGAELHELKHTWIESVRCVTESIDPPRLRITVTACSDADVAALSINFDGQTLHAGDLSFDAGHATFQRTFALPDDCSLWCPDDPQLHRLSIALADDDWHERVGLRTVACRGRDLLLNGRPIRLLGFNRHESHPQFGHTQPPTLLHSDLQQIRDLGCNFVRGAHYPQDRRMLDLCDEMGLLVWCEATAWGNTPEQIVDEGFVEAQQRNIDEMVAAARNHPSVIIWGVLNEGPSDDETSRPIYDKLLTRLRDLDGTRPATYATNRPHRDICLDLADIVALNVYPGWYEGDIDDIVPYFDRLAETLTSKGQDEKPLLISEIGAGAIYGSHDRQNTLWSEDYQADLLEQIIRHLFTPRDRVCGVTIWQFSDTRAPENKERARLRPRGFNNKGVVDEYRRPKLAYNRVRNLFRRLRVDRTDGL